MEQSNFQSPLYEDRIVAFADILGFGKLVEDISADSCLRSRLHYALTFLGSHRAKGREGALLEVSTFSDSIAISSRPADVFTLIWACGWIQAQLLSVGMLVRGGISSGPTFHQEDVLYGKGMLKAYRIESSAAIYPRIVVDPDLIPTFNPKLVSAFLSKDSDELWFVDCFKFEATAASPDDLAADGYDPREVYFQEVGEHIALGKKNAREVAHIAKWTWLENRYRMALKRRATEPSASADVRSKGLL